MRLDTLADVVFVAASAYKFLAVLSIPAGICIWTGVIAMIKVINIISGYVEVYAKKVGNTNYDN